MLEIIPVARVIDKQNKITHLVLYYCQSGSINIIEIDKIKFYNLPVITPKVMNKLPIYGTKDDRIIVLCRDGDVYYCYTEGTIWQATAEMICDLVMRFRRELLNADFETNRITNKISVILTYGEIYDRAKKGCLT